MPIVEPRPSDQVSYLLVRVDTDQDIETIVGKIETIENGISSLTRLDVIKIKHSTLAHERKCGEPTIYYP